MPVYIYISNLSKTDNTAVIQAEAGAISLGGYGRLNPTEYATNSAQFNLLSVTPEIQVVTIGGSPTGGTFTLTLLGYTTSAINYNDTAATIQAALVALPSVGPFGMSVAGSAGGPYTCTFDGNRLVGAQPLISATSSLTGGTSPSVTVMRNQTGAMPGGYGPSVSAFGISGSVAGLQEGGINAGNLGSAYTLALAGNKNVLMTGTLTANCTITVTGLSSPCQFQLLLTQDATGSRTATLSDGSTTLLLTVGATASTTTLVTCLSSDGTNIFVVGP